MKILLLLFVSYSSIFSQVIIDDEGIITDAETLKPKRYIPVAGQALQATSQVLNHPIVAAALQKISMNALATVASALNQVHQEELAKKSEVEKTLDRMASLKDKQMPLLQDGGGSGEVEDASGSGAESGSSENVQNGTDTSDEATVVADTNKNTTIVTDTIKKSKPHRHHHHRHHRHHHHKHSKKSEKALPKNDSTDANIDWSSLQNNSKVVGEIAEEANIPVKKLLAIFRSGASRSDIAKQTEELLNKTIESQAQLAQLFENEEEEKDKQPKPIKKEEKTVKHKKGKGHEESKIEEVASVGNTTANKNATYDVPKNIPQNCAKIVKQYTDGEATLKDYLKALKICKKNEEVTKQLANTTPLQREAVATQNLIQQEAYSYALNTMAKNYRPTAREQANAVLDKWRTNSFGEKNSAKIKTGGIPDAVKSFMTIQTPDQKTGKVAETSSSTTSTSEGSNINENLESAKSMILTHVTGNTGGTMVDADGAQKSISPDASALSEPQKVQETTSLLSAPASVLSAPVNGISTSVSGEIVKKNTIPNTPDVAAPSVITNNVFMNKLNMLSGGFDSTFQNQLKQQQIEDIANAEDVPHASSTVPDIILNQLSQENSARSNIPSPDFTTIVEQHQPQQQQQKQMPDLSSNVIPQQQINPMMQQIKSAFPQVVAKSIVPVINSDDITKKASVATLPQKTLLIAADSTNGIAPISTSLTDALMASKTDVSEVPVKPDVTASNIFLDDKLNNENSNLLTGQELAAERYIASLANPVLQEMPVDTSLVAALNSLSGFDSTIVNNPKDNLLLASLQKRQISEKNKRHVKREIKEANYTKKHKKHRRFIKHGKRDTSDKIKNAKPIERSNMGLPMVNSGPKLMDKIRDMSRVIAKP